MREGVEWLRHPLAVALLARIALGTSPSLGTVEALQPTIERVLARGARSSSIYGIWLTSP